VGTFSTSTFLVELSKVLTFVLPDLKLFWRAQVDIWAGRYHNSSPCSAYGKGTKNPSTRLPPGMETVDLCSPPALPWCPNNWQSLLSFDMSDASKSQRKKLNCPCCRWHDLICRKAKNTKSKLLELITEFSRVLGYKNKHTKSSCFSIQQQ
jgi:hypothetical protein